jgi:CDP-diacylglycerol--glycerol-3-phosphate 3-phosphatidyltransferase
MSSSTRSTSATFTDRLRRFFQPLVEPILTALMWMRVTPNMLSVFGALLQGLAGLIAASGQLTLAGLALFAFAPIDGLDGALARRLGVRSRFGAFLDSTLDRYADAAILFGLLIYTTDQQLILEQRLVFVTLVGALLISYTRARAEALGIECKIGLLSRVERYFILSATLILQQVTLGLIVLAVLTHVTVIQRVLHVYQAMQRDERAPDA